MAEYTTLCYTVRHCEAKRWAHARKKGGKCCVVLMCCRRARERWRPHHHLPRVLRLQRSARGRLPQCCYLPDQHPQVHTLSHTKKLLFMEAFLTLWLVMSPISQEKAPICSVDQWRTLCMTSNSALRHCSVKQVLMSFTQMDEHGSWLKILWFLFHLHWVISSHLITC